jgi:hypothetical protein
MVVAYIIFLPVTLAEDDKTRSNVTYNKKVLKYAHRMFNCNVQDEPHGSHLCELSHILSLLIQQERKQFSAHGLNK